MNEHHEMNRRHWDNAAAAWRNFATVTASGSGAPSSRNLPSTATCWNRSADFTTTSGAGACVVGSGDNYAAFALAGLGARVTSVDISQRQLAIAEDRARTLGLDIAFVRATRATSASWNRVITIWL